LRLDVCASFCWSDSKTFALYKNEQEPLSQHIDAFQDVTKQDSNVLEMRHDSVI